MNRKPWIKDLVDANAFVQEVGICTLFSEKSEGVPVLWDFVDLPEDGGGRTKWGARLEAIWQWKIELPTRFPDDVFYGKMKGGTAVLMSIKYLSETHYPKWHRPVEQCTELAQQVYELVRLNSGTTAELRSEIMDTCHCSKSRFETALKQLQVTLNIARLNEPGQEKDAWVPFTEVYEEIVASQQS